MNSSSGIALDVAGLRMRYGANDVLLDVTFQARRGEVLVMLGPNGAGKTTTVEILEGFRNRSAGRVTVLGVDPEDGDEHWRARVGVVLQSWRDHAKWRVRDLLDHLAAFYRPYSASDGRQPWDTDELIDLVGLTEQARAKIAALSGGQRRRLDVAIGIVGRPQVLFMDEPTAGFDPAARRDFHDLVHRLTDVEDTTVLLTTHDLDEAEKIADRILILAGGRIVADGSPDALAREIAGEAEVRWTVGDQRFVHTTIESTKFVHELFRQHVDSIGELEVGRASLENTYMALVRRHESDEGPTGALTLTEVAR
ncbi:ABC transporter ATP-binding protein [Rhodococcus marinonascens]|uniref:ABC transporter ATP-binding protein n=1 Tax=Rhodococcus marinonascens TaxID=38311 RepID=UPI000933EBDD|nr:ABC transporter ATP-binding protein [Rhodococcus marinonascens]